MSAWARVNKSGVGEIPQRLFSWLAGALPRACRWVADGWQAEPIISHLSTACFSNPARRYIGNEAVVVIIAFHHGGTIRKDLAEIQTYGRVEVSGGASHSPGYLKSNHHLAGCRRESRHHLYNDGEM